jgi:hypothetical protein
MSRNAALLHRTTIICFLHFTSFLTYGLTYFSVSISFLLPFFIPVWYIPYSKMSRSHKTANISQTHDTLSWMQLAICPPRTCRTLPSVPLFSIGRITSNETVFLSTSTVNDQPAHPPISFHFRHVFSGLTDQSIDRSMATHWILFCGFLVFLDMKERTWEAKGKRGEGRTCTHIRNPETWKELGFQIFERSFIQA